MQQRLLILRQPGNGPDRGQRKKEGEVERREERREKRQAPMWSTPYSESSPRHFLWPTNNTIILNIMMDKPTAEARDPMVPLLGIHRAWIQQLGEQLRLPGDYFLSSQKTNPTHESTTKPVSSKCPASSGIFTYGCGGEKTMQTLVHSYRGARLCWDEFFSLWNHPAWSQTYTYTVLNLNIP